jgi:hypothetical protein
MIPIENIPIRHIRELLSARLYRKLVRLGVRSIRDLQQLPQTTFLKASSAGTASWKEVHRLLGVINIDPESILATYLKNKEIELPFAIPQAQTVTLPVMFLQALKDFFSLVNNPFAKDCIFKRYGLEGKPCTLEEIGIYHGKTRERVRQIIQVYKDKLTTLTKGGVLIDANCTFSKPLSEEISRLSDLLRSKPIHSSQGIILSFSRGSSQQNESKFQPADLFLIELLQYDVITYGKSGIVFSPSVLNRDDLLQVCHSIVEHLKTAVVPVSSFDLTVRVKKDLSNRKLSNQIVEQVCGVLSEIQQVGADANTKYQARFDILSTQEDRAYRVLSESKKPMHYSEIQRTIKSTLLSLGVKRIPTTPTLNTLPADERFVPIGKSGNWMLREWGQASETISELMKEALHRANRPCSAREIWEYAVARRPGLAVETIRSYLQIYKQDFVRLIGHKYILADWKQNFKDALDTKAALRVEPSAYDSFILKQFESAGVTELKLGYLVDQLSAKFLYSGSGARARIKSTKYLNFRLNDGICYVSVSPEKLNARQIQNKRQPILALISDQIELLLRNTAGKSMPLGNLVKVLTKQYGFNRASVYRVVSEHPDLSKLNSDSGTIVVLNAPKEMQDVEEAQAKVREIKSLIGQGENATTEFKASLRWDNRTRQVNRELEYEVARAVCALANTLGGRLLIGVSDGGGILGINNDYRTFAKKNRDGFQLHLNNVLNNYLGRGIHSVITIAFPTIDGKEICDIQVRCMEPVFLNNGKSMEFHIRAAGSSQSLNAKEQYEYIEKHWKDH